MKEIHTSVGGGDTGEDASLHLGSQKKLPRGSNA